MAYFAYRAANGQGLVTEGTLQAATEVDARRLLESGGLRVIGLREMNPSAATAPKAAPATRPVSQPVSRPISTPAPVSATSTIPKPVAVVPEPIRTKLGTDKDRFFLFSQLAAAYRAGISPYQAVTEIANRNRNQFHEPLLAAAKYVRDGGSLADALAPYEDLFPDHVVATVRAGEVGGFVPEALDEVARHAEEAHKFKRWYFWVWFLAINALLSIPGMWMATRGLLGIWDKADARGGEGGVNFGESLGAMGAAFTGKWGALTLVNFALLLGLYFYLKSRRARPFRHRVGYSIPVFGKRSMHEGFTRFSWVMSRISRGGLPPARAWEMAVEAVPNLAMRQPLRDVGLGLQGNEKLSDIVHRAGFFPEEYAPIIATAEYTGDIPGALENLSRASGGEYMAAQNYAKVRSGCWGALGCFITSAVMLGMLWYAWYWELPAKVLSGMDP